MPLTHLIGYQILEPIYQNRSLVYRALRKSDQCIVAIKIPRQTSLSESELVQFQNQYFIAKCLESPHIIKLYALERCGATYAIVMEDGGIALNQWIRQSQHNLFDSIALRLNIAIQLTKALNALYQQHVIHRDIKPANILINPETHQIKLIDFSIATILPKTDPVLTNSYSIEGTLAYISPEQTGRINRGLDYRTDFYSLGITLYELFTGMLPFKCNDPLELIHSHIAKEPAEVSHLNPDVPQPISDIIAKLIAKDPDERYQNPRGLQHDLEQCQTEWNANHHIVSFPIATKDFCDRLTFPEQLYGRQTELSILKHAFERVAQGETQLIVIDGVSGAGKTALVTHTHRMMQHDSYFIRGKYDQLQKDVPFLGFVQAIREFIARILMEDAARLETWKTRVLDAVGDNGKLILDLIPEMEILIGKHHDLLELDPGAAQNRFNWVFQRLIRAFTQFRPLIIFLDDLQWADSGSLSCIETLMSDPSLTHLLLIGAYRSDEIHVAHNLLSTIQKLTLDSHSQQYRSPVHQIHLAPLTLAELTEFVSGTLKCTCEVARPLAQLMVAKTQGNPFFSAQFLQSLYEQDVLYFDWEQQQWQWGLEHAQSIDLNEDVSGLMLQQLKRLPPDSQKILQYAALLGNQFDAKTLSITSSSDQGTVIQALYPAIQAGLIIAGQPVYNFELGSSASSQKSTSNPSASPTFSSLLQSTSSSSYQLATCQFQFLHDRVQQAAHDLIPAPKRSLMHLEIGRQLLQQSQLKHTEDALFEIVNQLNRGADSIAESRERQTLIELNLQASRKARSSTAYDVALQYALKGIHLLSTTAWTSLYSTTLALHELAAETAYLTGQFSLMEKLATTILQSIQSPLDSVRIYEIKIQAYTARNEILTAIEVARAGLAVLGTELPVNVEPDDIKQAMNTVKALLGGTSPLDLACLPAMTDLRQSGVMKLLSSIIPATFIAAPQLFPWVILAQVIASIQYGNSPLSVFAYANYGVLLKTINHDIETAIAFARLSMDLANQSTSKELRAKTYYAVAAFVLHSTTHIRETLPLLKAGYEAGLESGSLDFVGYCAKDIAQHSYWIGKNLADLKTSIEGYRTTLLKSKQITTLNYCNLCQQTVLNLLGESDDPTALEGSVFSEQQSLETLKHSNDLNALFLFYLYKCVLCYLFNQRDESIEYAKMAHAYRAGGQGFITVPMLYFYESLALLGTDRALSQDVLIQIEENQMILQKLVADAAINYAHKYYLVEAERYRHQKDVLAAMNAYDQAINLANEHEYIQDQALACELAGRFYLQQNRHIIAQAYLNQALILYDRWGAVGKVNQLLNDYACSSIHLTDPNPPVPLLASDSDQACTPDTLEQQSLSTNCWAESLDLSTILKAYQALSSQIHLDHLIQVIMQLVLEHGGARRGILMLKQDEQMVVCAHAAYRSDGFEIELQSAQQAGNFPLSLINYVSRSQETLVSDDATLDPRLASDPFIAQYQPRSVLCIPIQKQGKLIGLLYLENSLTRGVFTQKHLQLLDWLTTQAAISLETALLYQQLETYNQTLEERVSERTAELLEKTQDLEQTLGKLQQTQTQLIQAEKMSGLGQMVAGIAHEINNPINFIYANLTYVEDYVNNLLKAVQLCSSDIYLKKNSDLSHKLQALDLDFIKEDLPKLLKSMQTGGDRIRSIVLGLRNFSRLDEADMKWANIQEGIQSTLMLLQHRLKGDSNHPPIKVVQDISSLPEVCCYPGQLNQVFMNLLSNSIDALRDTTRTQFLPQGWIPTISIAGQLNKDTLEIRIADNGPGIPDTLKSKIFDPFFTTKPVGKGTGLGLAISYQIIVEKHRGKLACNSAPGAGAEFTIQIPLQLKLV